VDYVCRDVANLALPAVTTPAGAHSALPIPAPSDAGHEVVVISTAFLNQ